MIRNKSFRIMSLFLAFLLAASMVSMAPVALAGEIIPADGFYIDDGELILYDGAETAIVVPEGVTKLSPMAFMGYEKKMQELTLPASLKTIPNNAFKGFTALRKVTLLGAETIGPSAFQGTTSLGEVVLPEGLTSIGGQAFAGTGVQFKEITIPASVVTLGTNGRDVFETAAGASPASGLLEITVAPGNSAYYSENGLLFDANTDALLLCPRGLTGGLVIPAGTLSIAPYAFAGTKLDYVEIPDTVTAIGANAFKNASALSSITVPGSVLSIGDSAFWNNGKLSNVEIQDGIQTIGASAFYTNYRINGVILPPSVAEIGDGAFEENDSRTDWLKIENPETVFGSSIVDSYMNITLFGDAVSTTADYVTAVNNPKLFFAENSAFEPVSSITLDKDSDTLEIGASGSLRVTEILPLNATILSLDPATKPYHVVTWFSTNSTVASLTVDTAAKDTPTVTVTGNNPGTARIYAKTSDGQAAYCDIVVAKGANQSDYMLDGTGKITRYIGDSPNLVIPAEIDGITVTGIADRAFQNGKLIESVSIPGTVKKIGGNAFEGCTSLSSVTMEAGVETIGSQTFKGCGYLNQLTLASTVTSIEAEAFMDCKSLPTLVLPAGLTSLAKQSFSGCAALTSVTLPDALTELKEGVFSSCAKLETVNFSESGNLTTIGALAFSGCGMETLAIPEGVTTIAAKAFAACADMKTLSLPSTVTALGGAHPRTIFEESESDSGGNALTHLTAAEGNPTYYTKDNLLYEGTTMLFCPRGRVDAKILEGTTRIEDYAFFTCFDLRKVTMPSTLKTIGHDAFHYCEALTDCTLPNGLETIENSAFFGCEAWENVVIPASVTSIGKYGFCETAAKTIVVPYGITRIEDYAFWGYEATLESIQLPDTVNYIGGSAFAYAKPMKYFVIPDAVTEIGAQALGRCISLRYLTLPENLTALSKEVFTGNDKMEAAYIPGGVTTIGIDIAKNIPGFVILSNDPASPAADYAAENDHQFIELHLDTSAMGGLRVRPEGFNRLVAADETGVVLNAVLTDKTAAVPSTLRQTVAKVNKNAVIGAYFDLAINKTVDSTASAVTSSSLPMSLIVDIPSSLIDAKNTYCLAEVAADGTVTPLTTMQEGQRVIAESANYGSYVLYAVAASSSGGNGGNGGSGGGSGGGAATIPDGETVPLAPGVPFSDIDGHWAQDVISAMCEAGVVSGYPNGTFQPNSPITRAEFLTMLMRTLKAEPTDQWMVQQFGDAEQSSFYYEYLLKAKAMGIAKGDDQGNFNPNANISREDMFVMTYRALVALEKLTPSEGGMALQEFADHLQVSDYATEALLTLVQEELLKGANGNLNPKNSATRAETAQFMSNILGYIA